MPAQASNSFDASWQSHDEPISARIPSAVIHARVLHVINGEDYSGAERVQDLLALRLTDEGYSSGFACVKPGIFSSARMSQDAPLYDVPMRGRFDLRPARELAEIVRREGYKIIHTHSARTAIVGRAAAALAGVPMVHHMHCQTAVEVGQLVLRWVNAITERISLFRIAGLIAVSETLKQYLLRLGVPASKITLIPNGVPGPESLPFRRAPNDTWTIGTVAMFRPRKGVETLLESIAHLRDAGHDVRMLAVGRFQTAEYETEVKALCRALELDEHVTWCGFTNDVPAELRKMDIFVLPSLLAEGMPMALLEAMAWGVPVIGTRVAGTIDIVRERETGLLAEPNNSRDLARAIAQIVSGAVDWHYLREWAHAMQQSHYSDVSMARGVAHLYSRILKQQKGTAATEQDTAAAEQELLMNTLSEI